MPMNNYEHTARFNNLATGGTVYLTQRLGLGAGVYHWGSYFTNSKAPPGG
jgi:hypothetical protein